VWSSAWIKSHLDPLCIFKKKRAGIHAGPQTADKPVDFSAVFLFLGWTVTV